MTSVYEVEMFTLYDEQDSVLFSTDYSNIDAFSEDLGFN